MIHIVPEAVEVPGRCAVSQSTTGPFVDTLVTIPRRGRLYLSVPWLTSIAGELGWVPKSELVQSAEYLTRALDEHETLKVRVERFDEDVQNVADAMVSWLGEIRARGDLIDELKAAREAIDTLSARVDELEVKAF